MNVVANQVTSNALSPLAGFSSVQRESFERALIRNYPGMTSLLMRHTRDPHLAADILHDAIVTTLARHAVAAEAPTPMLAGFIFRTAMNHLRNHWRRERNLVDDDLTMKNLVSNVDSLEEQSHRDANARAVRQVLHGMASWRDREVLVRFYMREESKQDICAALGLTEPDFNRIIFRARERLRRQLEGTGVGRADLFSLLTFVSLLTLIR